MKGWLSINESSKGRRREKEEEEEKKEKNVRVTLTASNNFQELFRKGKIRIFNK